MDTDIIQERCAEALWSYAGNVTHLPRFKDLPGDIREHYLGMAGHVIAAYKRASASQRVLSDG